MRPSRKSWGPVLAVVSVLLVFVWRRSVFFDDVPLPTDSSAIAHISSQLGENDKAAFRRFMTAYLQALMLDPNSAIRNYGSHKVRTAIELGQELRRDTPDNVRDELAPLPGDPHEIERIATALPKDEAGYFRVCMDAYEYEWMSAPPERRRTMRRVTVREAVDLGREMEDSFLAEYPPEVRKTVEAIRRKKQGLSSPTSAP